MFVSTIIPIPKNKRKSPGNSDDYRVISLYSVFGKVINNLLPTLGGCYG